MLYIFSLGILNGMPFFCLRRIYLNPMKEGSELKHIYIYIIYVYPIYMCVANTCILCIYIYISTHLNIYIRKCSF